MLDMMKLSDPYDTAKDTRTMISDLKLEKADLAASMTINPSGETARITLEVSNWDWRQALDVIAKEMGKQ